mmetsp:Transcript_23606/g.58844  ORF Transcript_23606/g.58844 Transcript_23606/m.58844 type:complete len:238 (+) Transcript_23606:647-1360(+)
MHPQEAVVEVHASGRLRIREGSRLRLDEQLQAVRHEHGVGVDLHDPVAGLGAWILEHLVPKVDEDRGVERRVVLAAPLGLQAARHDLRHEGLSARIEGDALVAEDSPLVAAEDAQLALGELAAQEIDLVRVRHHQSDAEQGRGTGNHRLTPCQSPVDVRRVGVAAAVVLQGAVVAVAIPRGGRVAAVETERHFAGARSARLRASGLFLVDEPVALLELLEARLRRELLVVLRMCEDA